MERLKLDIFPRQLFFKKPAGTSRGVYLTRKSWFVRMTSDDCLNKTAWGECAPLPKLSCDDRPDYGVVLRRLCDAVERWSVSGSPEQWDRPEGLAAVFSEAEPEWFRFPSMIFGLETALRSWERSGYALWDTPFSRGETGIPINGLIWMGDYEAMYRQIQTKLEAGYRCVKLKIGALDFDRELELLRLIRNRFSAREVELRVDANGAFSPDEAYRKLQQLSELQLHSIEQPIRAGQEEAMAKLTAETPLPIAFDEELIGVHGRQAKADFLDRLHPQFVVLKPSLHGGFLGCREWIEEAGIRGIGWWITSALESNVGLNAIAQWCAQWHPERPQGLGTGLLFTDNAALPLDVRGDALWFGAVPQNTDVVAPFIARTETF